MNIYNYLTRWWRRDNIDRHNDPELGIYKFTSTAKTPTRAYGSLNGAKSVGADIYADESVVIPAWSRRVVSTGIGLQIPEGHYIRIASRSGLSCKNNIDVGAGVIDREYAGECKVCLINSNNDSFEVKQGDKIAQAILERVSYPTIVYVSELDSNTARGCNGFGSSGT